MNKEYLESLKRLVIICLMYKDKLGTGLFMPTMLQDSRLTYFSKLLKMVDDNFTELHLGRYLPADVLEYDFLTWIEDRRKEYLIKEVYLTIAYKNIIVNDTRFIELPSIGKTEQRVGIRTRIYYNLIPDMVMHVLQRTQLEQSFPTKFHLYFSSPVWEEVHEHLKDAHKWYVFEDEQ